MKWEITNVVSRDDGQTLCHILISEEMEEKGAVITTPLLVTQVLVASDSDETAVVAAVEARVREFAQSRAQAEDNPLRVLVGRKGQIDESRKR
jgi:hypothetical protein